MTVRNDVPVEGVDYLTLKQAANKIQTENEWATQQLMYCRNWLNLGPYAKPLIATLQHAVNALQQATNAVQAGALHAGAWRNSYESAMHEYQIQKGMYSLMIVSVA